VCCRVGWKWPCTDTVAPGDGDRVLAVMVRVVDVVSTFWFCDVVLGEYDATDVACEVAAFCRAGCCALKAARKPLKNGLLVVMLIPEGRWYGWVRYRSWCSSNVFPSVRVL
jgi:hypothetical protein